MDHIKNSLSKHQGFEAKNELVLQAKKQVKIITGYEPKSIKLQNNKIIIVANNNYEAIEIRYKQDAISQALGGVGIAIKSS